MANIRISPRFRKIASVLLCGMICAPFIGWNACRSTSRSASCKAQRKRSEPFGRARAADFERLAGVFASRVAGADLKIAWNVAYGMHQLSHTGCIRFRMLLRRNKTGLKRCVAAAFRVVLFI